MQWLLLILWLVPDSGWIADRISETLDGAPGPFRIVWNGGTAPAEVESHLLRLGVEQTSAFDAARVEVRMEEDSLGDIRLQVRVLDAAGRLLASESYHRKSDLPTWRRIWMRTASPVLITAATGVTVYLLYNVRSR